jgi:hypothetical protein
MGAAGSIIAIGNIKKIAFTTEASITSRAAESKTPTSHFANPNVAVLDGYSSGGTG